MAGEQSEETQLHWKPCKPPTAVKVNAGLKAVNSKSHNPPPLLHLSSLTELEKAFIFSRDISECSFEAHKLSHFTENIILEQNFSSALCELLRGCTT